LQQAQRRKNNGKKTSVSTKKTTTSAKKASVKQPEIDPELHVTLLTPSFMEEMLFEINGWNRDFQRMSDNNLTNLQRRRKTGPGVRNYGFIDKASDLAEANPRYVQFFNINDLKNAIRNVEMCRDVVIALQQCQRAVSNSLLVYANEAYHMALIFYNLVRDQARRGDPDAVAIFEALRIFFRRHRSSSAEPTIKEIERDVHAILTHKKDGKVIIEGESPKLSGGKRKVIDEVRKDKFAEKLTENIEEKD
jgi:hypothetical protein